MTLHARPRLSILFVAVAALVLSLAGAPAVAKDGSVPARPTGLSTAVTHESVTLIWNAPDDDSITHYKVLRRDPAVHAAYWFVTIEDDTGTAATRYTDDTVKPEKRYIYRIKAVNPHGVSTWSRHAGADIPAAPAPEPTPLTARFVGMPAEHNGTDAFTFRIAFSDGINISYKTFRDHSLEVTGGSVTKARRVNRRRDLWEITVEPNADADVSVVLPVTEDCSTQGAVCTSDGKKLSNRVTLPVAGPESSYENSPATGAPTIAGTAQVGETLTAQTSGIADADGLSNPAFAYQWVSCGGPTDVCILGATDSIYTLVADDEGKTIKVLVSFTDDAGNPESLASDTVVVSSTSATEDDNTLATGAPTIADTVQVGETLTADTSGIADADGLNNPNFTYQWVSCGGPTDVCILGATDSTYTVVAADGGKSVKVLVSFTDDAGNPESLTSNVAAVSSTPPPTGEPQPPGAPGMPQDSLTYHVEDGRNWVTFRWTRASGVVDGYEVLRGQNSRSEFEGKVVARIDDPNATSYEDHTVIESSDYFFAVRAFNSAGTSGLVTSTACRFLDSVIAEGSQGLAYPDNLTARLTENGTAILLTWTAPTRGYHGQDVSPATGYQILRWDVKRGYPNYDIHVDNTGSTATSYVDRDITPNNTFIYQVRAWNDWGLGDRSFGATVKTIDLDVIGAPRNLRVSSSSEGALLTWDAPEDVADTDLSYRIYRREHSGATVPLVLLASGHSATSYTDGTVVPGTEYHYQVRVDGDPLGSKHGIPTKLRYGRYLAPQDLSVAPVAPDADPVALSVADARAREGTDETLDFRVSLSRAALVEVRVNYRTTGVSGMGGSATAGEDYTAVSGTLRFAPGETAKTVAVPLLDDVIDEGTEVFALQLFTARGAKIADMLAFGRLVNSDPLQRAWLARFGRTAATHVTDAVGERLRGGSGQGSHVTVGGYRLPVGKHGADAADEPAVNRLILALGQRLGLGSGTAPSGTGGTGADALTGGGPGWDPWADSQTDPDPRLGRSRTLDLGETFTLRNLLLGSSFRLALGANGDAPPGHLTAWGRFAGTRFNGRDGALSLDGDVLTGTVGVDGEWDRLLAGVAVSHSRGDGTGERGQGRLEQTLTTLHPYLRLAVNDRLDVWGVLGYGWGELTLEPGIGATMETDTALVMGAFGGRGILLPAAEAGGVQIATRTDAMFTRTTSDAVSGGAGNLASGDAEAHRLRLVLEGSRGFAWAEGRSLTPSVELGLRHDWGDAETGFGLELGGRVRYADPGLGLTIEGTVRGLLAHEDSDYEEWGASGSLRLDPGAMGQGLSLTLAPTWGAASSGVDGLWSRQTTTGLAPQGHRQTPAGRLTAEVGYGVAAPFGAGLLTPYAGTVLSDGADRTYRVGGRLQMSGRGTTGLTLNLEGTRQDPAGQQPVNQGLRLQLTWGF